MTPLSRMVVLAAAVVTMTAACGSDDGAAPSSSSATSTTPAVSARLDDAQCRESPPTGKIDRSASDLEFQGGGIRVAIQHGPAATPGDTNADSDCYGFSRWGDPNPEVPPDSLLFVFKGPGTDGAQIEFLVGELTGGVLPPIGPVRPTVGPLTSPINAQIGVSVAGTYYHAASCALKITTMSSREAAGAFTCPVATYSEANPFAPDDDVSYDSDESETAAPSTGPVGPPGGASPSTSTSTSPGNTASSPAAVALSGWFELTP
ncbi:hypothetical protein AAFP35_20765 [Gordonia sp. CPCC 206044]|uniref:hypothetical protein n=1 Tax=Gordonia sp. CPCC 206044 TaxID=3140793 RepID=UPI003AF40A62